MVAGNLVKRCRLSSVWGDCLFEQFGIGHLLQPIYLFLTVPNGPEIPNEGFNCIPCKEDGVGSLTGRPRPSTLAGEAVGATDLPEERVRRIQERATPTADIEATNSASLCHRPRFSKKVTRWS